MAYTDPISMERIFDSLSDFEQDFVDAEAVATGVTRNEIMVEIFRDGLHEEFPESFAQPVVH